ncbi:MAG: BrnT family toxin [Alphaproteobacteria bacterium]|nr:BrnT family toxin [Alphaproteobacteria bacterium]
MEVTFDPAKNERDIRERGLSFERAADFDLDTALLWIDGRRDYAATLYVALGRLDGRMHVLCFTETSSGIRVISFRRANAREMRRYEKLQAARR